MHAVEDPMTAVKQMLIFYLLQFLLVYYVLVLSTVLYASPIHRLSFISKGK